MKRCAKGDAEEKEYSASALVQIAQMDHGRHSEELFHAGAVKPLVGVLSNGSVKAQTYAATALASISIRKAAHQKAVVEVGGAEPLVGLLKTGSAKVQEEVRRPPRRPPAPLGCAARAARPRHLPWPRLQAAAALAALDADVSHQEAIIKAGVIPSLVAVLKNGSAAATASAAQAIANAAAFSHDAQRTIASVDGSIGRLLELLGAGKAQKPAANALAKLAHECADPPSRATPRGPWLRHEEVRGDGPRATLEGARVDPIRNRAGGGDRAAGRIARGD